MDAGGIKVCLPCTLLLSTWESSFPSRPLQLSGHGDQILTTQQQHSGHFRPVSKASEFSSRLSGTTSHLKAMQAWALWCEAQIASSRGNHRKWQTHSLWRAWMLRSRRELNPTPPLGYLELYRKLYLDNYRRHYFRLSSCERLQQARLQSKLGSLKLRFVSLNPKWMYFLTFRGDSSQIYQTVWY